MGRRRVENRGEGRMAHTLTTKDEWDTVMIVDGRGYKEEGIVGEVGGGGHVPIRMVIKVGEEEREYIIREFLGVNSVRGTRVR